MTGYIEGEEAEEAARVALEAAEEEYRQAWEAAFGDPDPDKESGFYFSFGVPADLLPYIAGLADGCLARWGADRHVPIVARMRLYALEVAAWWINKDPATVAVVRPWLAVLDAEPDFATAEAVYSLWWEWTSLAEPDPGWVAWMGLPGDVGAWGWAAGLTPVEAAGVPVADLQAIAALRGYAVGAVAGVR